MKIYINFLLFTAFMFAHPHTFVDVYPTVYSTKHTVDKIRVKWIFDDMTSQMLSMEFDANANGKIDTSEIPYIKKEYFDNLETYDYYTHIKIKDKKKMTNPINFICYIEKSRVVYQFDIDISKDKKDVTVEFYDKDRFTALVLKDEFVTSSLKHKSSYVDYDFYFGYKLEFK